MNKLILNLIERYKSLIGANHMIKEKYKWKLVQTYKGKPDTNAPDFRKEIESIDYSNLIYYNSIGVLKHIARKKPEDLRKAFVHFFDEKQDLLKRLHNFSNETLNIYRKMGETHKHHQDERAMATYLTYKYPDKYTFYKSSYYKAYCNLLNIKPKNTNRKYVHYLSLINDLIENYIKKDRELIELVKKFVPEYNGINHLILAQDILFQVLEVPNYWIFQANPKIFNLEQSLSQNNDGHKTWNINQHKNDIKKGDKVILWQTGKKNGVYALATVKSNVYETTEKDENGAERKLDIVELEIDYNLAENPILKEELYDIKVFDDFYAGQQGTNLKATKEQFEYLEKLAKNRKPVKIWLYAPGEHAYLWEEMYQNDLMCIGWDDIGNLKKLKTKENIKKVLIEKYGKSDPRNDTHANYELLYNVKPGDIVIAKRGIDTLLGYGIVTSEYLYDTNRKEYKSCRKVKWQNKGEWYSEEKLPTKTLTDITKYKEFASYLTDLVGAKINYNMISSKSNYPSKIHNYPLNNILYGPPGTGKTYNSILIAAEIVSGKKIDNYNEALKIFNKELHKRIEFITFHQNFSYEDFIQGLRPDTQQKELVFERKDGVLKKLATNALFEFARVLIDADPNYQDLDFSDVPLTYERKKNILAQIPLEDLKKIDNTKVPDYVLIIDEINRANISRVFGELITLIEPDKRLHGKIPLQVELPSGDTFIVPSNLYILGTMNTADKSIALLDIALRRRFHFEAFYPKYEIYGETINRPDVLKKINEYIIKTKGYDFQIGHSYFMKKNFRLSDIINHKVIPLLLEYYLNDSQEVINVLKNAGLNVKEDVWPIQIEDTHAN